MLLLKDKLTWMDLTTKYQLSLVLVSAGHDKQIANDIAIYSAFLHVWATVIESNSTHELYVMLMDNESKAVGLARKLVADGETAEPWFLRRKDRNSPLLIEFADRKQEMAILTETGFILPNGRSFTADSLFIKPSLNTMMLHSRGHNVGEHF